jgi:hypothetical protein
VPKTVSPAIVSEKGHGAASLTGCVVFFQECSMGAIFPQVGLYAALADLISSLFNNARVHLYTNNYTPVPATMLTNFTELVGTGYAPQGVGSWGSPVLGGDGFFTTTGAPVTFTNSGVIAWPAAYGWFITDSTSTLLISAGLFSAPITVGVGGDMPFSPIMSQGSEY